MKDSSQAVAASGASPRRHSERLRLQLPIIVKAASGRAMHREETTTFDVSRGGASFAGRQAYRSGMTLRLSFPETAGALEDGAEIPARVIRVNPPSGEGEGSVVALQFTDPALATLAMIEVLRVKLRAYWALLDILQVLAPGVQVEEMTQKLCRHVERAMDAERVLLFLRSAPEGTLRARVMIGGRAAEFDVRPDEGLVGQAVAAGTPVRVESAQRDSRLQFDVEKYLGARTRSILCVPLAPVTGLPPGALVIVNKLYGTFTHEDEQVATAIAHQVSMVLRNARLYDEIRAVGDYSQSILHSIATGVFTFNVTGNLTTLNRVAANLVAPSGRPEIGTHFSVLFDTQRNRRVCSLVEDVLKRQHRRSAYDLRIVRSDEVSFDLNLRGFPLRDAGGSVLGAVLATEDITQEHRLINTLSRYVAREVAEQALHDRHELKLGGTRAEVTILFADIRNFTSISERLDPEDVVGLLNTYYPQIINAVFRHQGMLDKFIGDAILAVFGVPTRRPDDPLRAARAALDIRKQIHTLNKEREQKKQIGIEIGIGITSGTVISGNIGSERRMDFTVIGDPVNLAERLEGLTREVEHKILISEQVVAVIQKEIPCEPVGRFKVKGKQEEVLVYAVKTAE